MPILFSAPFRKSGPNRADEEPPLDLLFRAASQRPKFGVAKRLLGTAAAFLLCCSSGILLMVLVDGGDRDLGGGDLDLVGGDLDLVGGDLDLERLLDGGGDRRRGDGVGGDLFAGERRRSKSWPNLSLVCHPSQFEFCRENVVRINCV